MSLDVHLTKRQMTDVEVFWSNITHNLGRMAAEAGIYKACWKPEELGITKAKQLIPILKAGLKDMKKRPEHYRQFGAPNGWGTYDDFVPWVENYLHACIENPNSKIEVSR